MTRAEMEREFPNLAASGYAITSPPSTSYNCIAWALGDTTHYYDPTMPPFGYYWPRPAPRANTVQAWATVFQLAGFEMCSSPDHKRGYERIAIYARPGGIPTHVARQQDDGTWTSKLGSEDDIEHRTLTALEGDEYGAVVQVMRRPDGRSAP